MPLTGKGAEIKAAMEEQYGKEKGESVFYASANKGTIKGVHDAVAALADAVTGFGARFDAYADRRRADALGKSPADLRASIKELERDYKEAEGAAKERIKSDLDYAKRELARAEK